jgi:hypothetical protein
MEFNFLNNILRIFQLLWTLLITALIGNAIATYHSTSGSGKSAINFTIFVAVLSWIAALYGLIASFVTSIAMPIVLLALDGLAVLFTFISAVVLAAKLGAVNCSNLVSEQNHNCPCHMWVLTAAVVERKGQRLYRFRFDKRR